MKNELNIFENRLGAIEAKIDNLQADVVPRVALLEKTVELRGKNHERNNAAFAEITADYNQLQKEKNVLQEKLYVIEREQAVQQSTVTRMLGEIIEIKKEVKDFMEKVVSQLATINTSIATGRTRDTTIIAVVKFLMQCTALAITIGGSIAGVLKYIGAI